MSLTSLLKKAALSTAVTLASFAGFSSQSGCGGGYNLGNIYIPDSGDATDIGAINPQPIPPEDAFVEHTETIYSNQSAFVDIDSASMISRNSNPGVLISSSGYNSQGVFNDNTYPFLQFNDLSRFSNKTIRRAVLKMPLLNSSDYRGLPAQGQEQFYSTIFALVDPWDARTLSWNSVLQMPHQGWDLSLLTPDVSPNYFTHFQTSPGTILQWDLTPLRLSNGQGLIPYMSRNPTRISGLVIAPKTERNSSGTGWRQNYRTFQDRASMDLTYILFNEQ